MCTPHTDPKKSKKMDSIFLLLQGWDLSKRFLGGLHHCYKNDGK